MAAIKIKAPKKRVDKAQEILTVYDRIKMWTDEHYTLVAAGVAVLLLIPLFFWGFSAYREAGERKAQEAYARIIEKWPEKDVTDTKPWEEIVPRLQKCIEDHSGTKAALGARLDLARAFFYMGRYEDARKWSAQVLEQLESGNDLRMLARYQLAQALEMLSKPEEAMAQWQALSKEPLEGLKREVDWRLAALYAKKGQYSEAVRHYEEAINASGSYPPTPLLKEELAGAKMKIP